MTKEDFIKEIKAGKRPALPTKLELTGEEYLQLEKLFDKSDIAQGVYLSFLRLSCPELSTKDIAPPPSPQYQPPAFPYAGHSGLTKREYIATHLMAVFCRRYTDDEGAARYAVNATDLLLAALNKPQAPENDGTDNGKLLDEVKPKTEG